MRSPLARISRARFIVCAALCLATSLAPARVSATHYVVDINGSGDFTSIQAALDAWQTTGWRDSVLVMPGVYPENLVLSTHSTLLGVGGAAATAVGGASFDDFGGGVEGLRFTGHVEFDSDINPGNVLLRGCVFQATVHGGAPSLEDCDFYARTDIRTEIPGWTLLRNLRSHGAPFYLGYYNGPLTLSDCSFEGPADTLLYIPYVTQYDGVTIRNCRFEGGKFGMVLGEGYEGAYEITGCSFRDQAEAGIWHEAFGYYNASASVLAFIGGCKFERCGTAVHWRDESGWDNSSYWSGGSSVGLVADTVLACTGDGIVLGPIAQSGLSGCIVDGSGGRGVVFRQARPVGVFNSNVHGEQGWNASVFGTTILESGGAGLVFEDSTGGALGDEPIPRNVVRSSSFTRNSGPGMISGAGIVDVEDCSSFANGGGFILNTPVASWPARLVSNTSALNRGDGFRLTGPAYPGDSLKFVQHNLAALNVGAGFRVQHQSFGSFAFNDAWSNYQGQYVGAWGSADSNLTVDPRFCDLGAGNLGLQQGSPAGAGGVYGLIGALPEQCPNTAAVKPAAPRLSFAIRPSIARGSVEFVPPSNGPDGRVEIFDVTGRRHWGAAFGPTTGSLRWQGQSETGHAKPGLYWVRFTRAGESQTQRLVWLR